MFTKQVKYNTGGEFPWERFQFDKMLATTRRKELNPPVLLVPLQNIRQDGLKPQVLVTFFLVKAFSLFTMMKLQHLTISPTPSFQFTTQRDILLNTILQKCYHTILNSTQTDLILKMSELQMVARQDTLAIKLLTSDGLLPSTVGASPMIQCEEAIVLQPSFEILDLVVDPTIQRKDLFSSLCHLELIRDAMVKLPQKLQKSVFAWANPILSRFPFFTIYSIIFFGKKTSHKKIPLIKEFFFSIEHLVPRFLPPCFWNSPPHVLVIFLMSKDAVTQDHLFDFISHFGPLTLTTADAYISRILAVHNAVRKSFPEIQVLWKPRKTDPVMLRFDDVTPHTTDPIPLVPYFRFLEFLFNHSEEASFIGLLFHAAMLSTARMNEFLGLLHKDISLKRNWDTQTETWYFEFVLRYQRSKTRRMGYGAEVRFPTFPLPCLSFNETFLKIVQFNRVKQQFLLESHVGGHVSSQRFYTLLKKYWKLFYTNFASSPAQLRAYESISVGPHSARKTGCRFYKALGLTAPMVKLTSLHSKYSVVLQETYFQPSVTELHSEILQKFRDLF